MKIENALLHRYSFFGRKRQASYHRTAKNILINFAKLNYNEAKLILVHELTHKADEEVLFKASVDFSNEDRQKEIYNFAS